jgi:hypothetical protein
MKPGTRVVCINDDFPDELRRTMNLPEMGKIYVVRDILRIPLIRAISDLPLKGGRTA